MTLTLVFMLTACGGTENDIRGDIDSNNSTTSTTDNKDATESKDEKEFSTGKVATNKYTNEFVGISVELGDDWTFMTDAQIEQNNKEALGLMGDDYKALMESATTFTDMMATNANQMDTVNVTFEKLTGSNLLLTEEKYVELSKDGLKSGLESMGMTNVVLTDGKATFAGKEHSFIAVSAEFSGVAVYERLAVVKCNGYMVSVTACTWQTDGSKAILDSFKAI